MPPRIVNVALLGLGTVGSSVARLLQRNAGLIAERTGLDVRLRRVADRDPARLRSADLDGATLSDDARDVIHADDVHVVVELIGGLEPARTFILGALRAGKHVVTANKQVMAESGRELLAEAAARGVALNFSASAGGAIPIIPALADRLVGDRVHEILGILNGTTNFVLTAMTEKSETFEAALAEAQRLGYAEADPVADVTGKDAARKLAILARLAFGVDVRPEQIGAEGIDGLRPVDVKAAAEFGYVVKLLAIARVEADGLSLRVHPALLPRDHPLASVRGEQNAVYLRTEAGGEMMFLGRGAGGPPTATAVVADIVSAALGHGRTAAAERGRQAPRLKDPGETATRAYLRFTVQDRPGNIGRIASVLGDHQISLASVHASLLDGRPGWGHVELLTGPAPERALQAAFRAAQRIDGVAPPFSLVRIEDESGPSVDEEIAANEPEAGVVPAGESKRALASLA